jgi:hypothetical protein
MAYRKFKARCYLTSNLGRKKPSADGHHNPSLMNPPSRAAVERTYDGISGICKSQRKTDSAIASLLGQDTPPLLIYSFLTAEPRFFVDIMRPSGAAKSNEHLGVINFANGPMILEGIVARW